MRFQPGKKANTGNLGNLLVHPQNRHLLAEANLSGCVGMDAAQHAHTIAAYILYSALYTI